MKTSSLIKIQLFLIGVLFAFIVMSAIASETTSSNIVINTDENKAYISLKNKNSKVMFCEGKITLFDDNGNVTTTKINSKTNFNSIQHLMLTMPSKIIGNIHNVRCKL